jgi:arsenite methyltransferase
LPQKRFDEIQDEECVMMLQTANHEQAAAIRSAVKSKYQKVAADPKEHFSYPVGKESALRLGYDSSWIRSIPIGVVNGFVGVGNPFRICMPKSGDRVLDAGCGCGLDTYVAALLAGAQGRAIGIDLTDEMLSVAKASENSFREGNVQFYEGSIERLPFDDASFDLVISNGVINLIPDKPSAFAEIARVLRQGGVLAAADLLVVETIPPDVLANTDAWST